MIKNITFFLVVVVLALTGNAISQVQNPWENWQNKPQKNDTFVGKIWSAGEGAFILPSKLAEELKAAKYVLIGETHDNADHHLLQAWLIEQLAKDQKPAIVMEMISEDQAQSLEEYMSTPDANSTGLGPALNWQDSGWPQWKYYQPIADVVFNRGLSLFPGNPDKLSVRNLARNGIKTIEPSEQKRLAMDIAMTKELSEALNQEIIKSHCNLLPETMIAPMVKVQRFRDGKLARALVDASEGANGKSRQAILITGSGHARNDRAVPWYLARQDSGGKTLTVLLVEAGHGAENIEDLITTDPQGKPAADYFWFTPRVEREDQCEQLRKRFKK
ncbi:MAG: ChaN family lipoprotein [Rhizobiaceae bacterium]|nr:ChaN family lipoprotein [Rhizobiaceae bacterium]